MRIGEIEVVAKIAGQRRASVLGPQQRERREMGQVDAVVEDEAGFEPTVGQEQAALHLRQLVAILGHRVVSPCVS